MIVGLDMDEVFEACSESLNKKLGYQFNVKEGELEIYNNAGDLLVWDDLKFVVHVI
jgi:hypothetical protein